MNTSKTPKTHEVTKTFFGGAIVMTKRVTVFDSTDTKEVMKALSRDGGSGFPVIPTFPTKSFSQSRYSWTKDGKYIEASTFGEFLQKILKSYFS